MSAAVLLAARLGSPASEQAAVMACGVDVVERAGWRGDPLPSECVSLLALWLLCVTWRHDYRAGAAQATEPEELDVVGTVARSLPWVPDEWCLDHRDALDGLVIVPIENISPRTLKSRGRSHGRSRLTRDAVTLARALFAAGGTSERELAARFGVGKTTMHRALAGETWM